MIQDFFCNTIKLLKREELVSYQDGIPKKTYKETTKEVPCRVGKLNFKDLQFLSKIADVNILTRKLFTSAECPLEVKDQLIWEGKTYKVIYVYEAQAQAEIHHKRSFIQLVE